MVNIPVKQLVTSLTFSANIRAMWEQSESKLEERNAMWVRVEPLLHFEDETCGRSQQMWMKWDRTGVCSCWEGECPASRLFCSPHHFVCPFLRGTLLSNQSPSSKTEWAIMFHSKRPTICVANCYREQGGRRHASYKESNMQSSIARVAQSTTWGFLDTVCDNPLIWLYSSILCILLCAI
jgi:hypothetical protein